MDLHLKNLQNFYRSTTNEKIKFLSAHGRFSIGWHEKFGFMTAAGSADNHAKSPRFFGPEFGEPLVAISSCRILHASENLFLFPQPVWNPVVYTTAWKSAPGPQLKTSEIRQNLISEAARQLEAITEVWKANNKLTFAELEQEEQSELHNSLVDWEEEERRLIREMDY